MYGSTFGYNHGGLHSYETNSLAEHNFHSACPAKSMNTTGTVSHHWHYPVKAALLSPQLRSLVLELTRPAALTSSGYGAPSTVWLNLTSTEPSKLLLTAVWSGKRASMLPELSWLELQPKLDAGAWTLLVDKVRYPHV